MNDKIPTDIKIGIVIGCMQTMIELLPISPDETKLMRRSFAVKVGAKMMERMNITEADMHMDIGKSIIDLNIKELLHNAVKDVCPIGDYPK